MKTILALTLLIPAFPALASAGREGPRQPSWTVDFSFFHTLENSYKRGSLDTYFQERTGNPSKRVDQGSPAFYKLEADLYFPIDSESFMLGMGLGCAMPPSHSLWGTDLYYGGRSELVMNPYIVNFSIPMKFRIIPDSGLFFTFSPDLLMGWVTGYLHTSNANINYQPYAKFGAGASVGMDYMFAKWIGLSMKAGVRSLKTQPLYNGNSVPLLNNGSDVMVDLSGSYAMAGAVLSF
jgi:hypothetical protein